jgi:hypothetical protein
LAEQAHQSHGSGSQDQFVFPAHDVSGGGKEFPRRQFSTTLP